MIRFALRRARAGQLSGYSAAAVAVLIWASYPVATRAGVTGSFTPQDLMLLRFGVGALLFLPYLAFHFHTIRRDAWLQGVPLTLFQGAGMAALVIWGLQFAPANHAAALGPGVAPAWVALLGFLVFSRRPSARMIVGAALCATGVITLAAWSASGPDPSVLAGDAMFVAASALGSLYVLQLRNWGIGAIPGAAIVTLYSALVVLPWYLWSASGALWRVAPFELLSQVLWQGVLIGCVALVALNHAIARLGPERSSALVALVPALSAVLGLLFLGEIPSGGEIAAILAISAGVSVGASRGYGGSPAAASAVVKRSAAGLSRPG
ncbi:MAG: DMT family transporter [Betaproteobacteria bacterium]|nr:DMT family transporter [Betaproteobacteria bacterium]